MSSSTDPIEWFRYPFVAAYDLAKAWLTTETLLGLASNTLDAYARGLDDFLEFCQKANISPVTATRADLARYVGDLRQRPRSHAHQSTPDLIPSVGLSNATLQQRLTAVRLFFDFLIEEGKRADHPVGRGRYTPGKSFGADRERALVPRFQTMPWIPSDEQWRAFLAVVKQAPLRTRCMAALAYDAGLRREEVCSLRSDDLDPAHRMVRVRAKGAESASSPTQPPLANCCERIWPIGEPSLTHVVLCSSPSRQGILRSLLLFGPGRKLFASWRCQPTSHNSQPTPF